ncbi:MAG: hypothetical protein ACK5RL_09920 [Acidimicrobiales bacterium]
MVRVWSVALLWLLLVGCSAPSEGTDPAGAEPGRSDPRPTAPGSATPSATPSTGPGTAEGVAAELGPGSLVIELLPYRADEVVGGDGITRLTVPLVFIGPPCPQVDPSALTTAASVRDGSFEVVQVSVAVYPDEAAADEAVATTTDIDPACAEARWAATSSSWSGLGIGEIVTDLPAGERTEPPVPAPGAVATRFGARSAVGELTSTEVVYRTGVMVTTVHATGMADRFGPADQDAVAARIYDHQQGLGPLTPERDPDLDAVVDRLRTGAATMVLPTDRYRLHEGYATASPTDPGFGFANCGTDWAVDGAVVGVNGPSWNVTAQPSNMGYTGWVVPDEAAASAAVATLAETPFSCEPSGEPRALELVSARSGTVTVGGHDLAVLEATVRPVAGGLPTDLAVEVVRVADGTGVHQYWFIGLDGDQPDLEALAVAAVEAP